MAKRTNKANVNETVNVWIVRVDQGLDGWKDFRVCYSPAEADDVIYDMCRNHGAICSDFTVVKRTI